MEYLTVIALLTLESWSMGNGEMTVGNNDIVKHVNSSLVTLIVGTYCHLELSIDGRGLFLYIKYEGTELNMACQFEFSSIVFDVLQESWQIREQRLGVLREGQTFELHEPPGGEQL